MIIMGLLQLVKFLFNIIFGWVTLPDFPAVINSSITTVFNYMEAGLGILFIFVSRSTVQILLPLLIAVINFDELYTLGMWIIRKIPMANIH